jgi:hypothetical protein
MRAAWSGMLLQARYCDVKWSKSGSVGVVFYGYLKVTGLAMDSEDRLNAFKSLCRSDVDVIEREACRWHDRGRCYCLCSQWSSQ